jgi:hypothetical protein
MIATVAGAPRPQVESTTTSSSPEGTSQRDPRGRFARGNKGGPGNPFARRTAQFRKVLLEMVTDEDIQAAARKLIEQARAGDLAAIRLLFSYTIGKPAAAVDPDRVDVEEWKLLQEGSVAPQQMNGVLQSLPADWVVQMLQIAWPCVVQTIAQEIGAGIKTLNREEAARARRAQAAAERRKAEGPPDGKTAMPLSPSANGANGVAAAETGPSRNGSNGPAAPGQEPAVQQAAGGSGPDLRAPTDNTARQVQQFKLTPELTQLLLDVLEELPIGNGDNGHSRRAPHDGSPGRDGQAPRGRLTEDLSAPPC